MPLSATQSAILAAAAAHPERLVVPPKLGPAPREAIRRSLLAKGLIEPAAQPGTDAATAWPVGTEVVAYRITTAGLAAMGLDAVSAEAAAEADMPPEGPAEPAGAGQPSAGAAEAGDASAPLATPPESRTGLPAAQPQRTLLAAARAVLVASEDKAGDRAGLPDAVAGLRSALAGKPARIPRDPDAPRKPREGTKQEAVLALLRRPEGATVGQVAEATGWQTHTVRGFFAGLKRRQGITFEVLERVRQLGPGAEGAKGSYSVYRGADAG